MSDGFSISIDTYGFKKRVDNFMGHTFTEFFRNPGDDAMIKIHGFLAALFDPYVPFNTGDLSDSITISPEALTYNTDYAHYMYEDVVYGPNFLIFDKEKGEFVWRSPKGKGSKHPTERTFNYTNPLATRHWDEAAIEAHQDLVNKTIRDIIIEAWNNEH